jgi:hypothetical protein
MERMKKEGWKGSLKEAEERDIDFWANKTPQERLIEAERLRRLIWTYKLGKYPERIEKTGRKIRRDQQETN